MHTDIARLICKGVDPVGSLDYLPAMGKPSGFEDQKYDQNNTKTYHSDGGGRRNTQPGNSFSQHRRPEEHQLVKQTHKEDTEK